MTSRLQVRHQVFLFNHNLFLCELMARNSYGGFPSIHSCMRLLECPGVNANKRAEIKSSRISFMPSPEYHISCLTLKL